MDLTRIDAWTRQMLETEACKRGIGHAERRTRGELVNLIVRHDYANVRSAGDARRVVESLLGSAVSSLPSPWDALARLRARVSLPGRPKKPDAVSPAVSPARGTTSHSQPPESAVGHRVFDKPVVNDVAAVSSNPRPPAATPAATPTATPSTTPTPVPAATPAFRSAPDTASTRTFVEEPIRTHSMARLLASQGHRERALAIYEELIAKNSADNVLLQEAEALRHNTAPAFAAGELPKPASGAQAALPESADHIECDQQQPGALRLRWSITNEGQARARALLGNAGELAVRVVTIRPDHERVVRSEITEHGPIAADGEWTATLVDKGARCFAAVGLRDAQRFVSIVHLQA